MAFWSTVLPRGTRTPGLDVVHGFRGVTVIQHAGMCVADWHNKLGIFDNGFITER